MNKLFVITAATILLFCQKIYAQNENQNQKDSIVLMEGRIKIITEEKNGEKSPKGFSISSVKDKENKLKPVKFDWFSFDLGFNNYVDKTGYNLQTFAPMNPNFENGFFNYLPNANKNDFELKPGKSVNVNFGIVRAKINLITHHLNFVTGLNYDINNWNYKSRIIWNKKTDNQTFAIQGNYITKDSLSFKKNKLVTNYLQVPLLLRLETSPKHKKKNVCLSAGVYGGYLVRAHTKQVYENSTEKKKVKDDFNLTQFQYGLQGELSYRSYTIYFKKSLTPLTEYGVEQYPYSFGVRLMGW